MRVRDGITVKLSEDTVRLLKMLKVQLNKQSYDEVIKYLINYYVSGRRVEV